MTDPQKSLAIEYAVAFCDGDPEVAARTAINLALDRGVETILKGYAADKEVEVDSLLAAQDEGRARLQQEKNRYSEAKK